jgi:glycosidase
MKIHQLLFATLLLLVTACQNQQTQQTVVVNASQTPIPDWAKNSVIYEVNVRQYTPEGTFAALQTHLPRLKEMGVDILWIMPIHPIGEKNRKEGLGSYYSVRNYTEVNSEYGSIDDFKNTVEQAHKLGMKVIIDWVANHSSCDNPWITDHPDWYAKDSTGKMYGPFDWTDVAQLDYKNHQLWKGMADAMKFWVTNADIDGFRCDVAGMVPVAFWDSARVELNKVKPIFMLAEDEKEKGLLKNAFNANYGWTFHHLMNDIAKGKKKASDIAPLVASYDTIYPVGAFPIQFTSNHDENSWNGTEYERLGKDAVPTFAALTFVIPGMPLIYTGQEAALDKRLRFFTKDTVNWNNLTMGNLYQQLASFKKTNPALANGTWGGKLKVIPNSNAGKVIAFERQLANNRVVAIFNLSADTANIKLSQPIEGEFTDFSNNSTVTMPQSSTLKAWEYRIYSSK